MIWNKENPKMSDMNDLGDGVYETKVIAELENGSQVFAVFQMRDHNNDGGFVEQGFFDSEGRELKVIKWK